MKIVCDSCGAKYSIADEKVRGKVFKIRCKKCSDVIVVKGQSGEESGGDGVQDEPMEGDLADSGYDGGSGVSEWYAVVDGDQVGPITPDEIESYYNQGTLDDDSYAWREGLEDWQRLDALEEFDHLTAESAGPEDETVVAAPGDEPAAGEDVAAADEKTVVTEPGQFDFEAPNDAAAAGGDFSEHSGAEEGDSSSVEISDELAGEFAGDGPGEQSADPTAGGSAGESTSEPVGSDPSGGGESGFGAEADNEFAESGGFDAQSGSGAGDFAGQDGGGDEGSFESFGDDSTQSGVSGTSNPATDGGSGQQGPDMSSEDMVGQRSENSVLFSLSSVDEMKAVDGPEEEEDVSGAGATTEGSGLIDIQNLASSHAAMSSEEEEADGGGAPVDGADSSPSPSPASTNNQQLSNDSVNMPSLAPSGSRGNNTGLIIAVIIGGFILLSAVVVATVLYLNRGKQTKKIVEKKTKAAASAKEAESKNSPEESSEKDEKVAEKGEDSDGEKGESKDKEGDDGDEGSGDDEDKKAENQDEETDDSEEEETSDDDEETEVASNDNTGAGGGSGGHDRGGTGSAEAPTSSDNSGEGGGGGGSDDGVDELLDNVDDEPSSGGGETAEKELKDKPTRGMVKNTIGKYSSRVGTCASEKNRNNLSGTLFIKFRIQPSGRVSGASIRTSKFKGTDVGKCVQRVVSSMKFPETKNGMPVKFPFSVE